MNITNVNRNPNHSQVRAEAQKPYKHRPVAWSPENVAAEPGALIILEPGVFGPGASNPFWALTGLEE